MARENLERLSSYGFLLKILKALYDFRFLMFRWIQSPVVVVHNVTHLENLKVPEH